MLDKLAGLALVLFGLVNAVPSAAAVHPVTVTADYIDDDLTGSGRELRDSSVKVAQRRNAVRLRVLSDVDRATEFYGSLGWRQDVTPPGSGVVQLTPPASWCSVQFGANLTSAAPGSAKAYLIVSDIEATRPRP